MFNSSFADYVGWLGGWAVTDTNEDTKLDFDEFHTKIKEYLQTAFIALDDDKDGSLYNEAKIGKIFNMISFKFLDTVLNEALNFFDINKDRSVSLDDFDGHDRNEDHPKRLSDVFGKPLISLPAPLYNLYTNLDSNRDEKLADTEAKDFILRTFRAIDTNTDCHISAEEVVSLLQEVGVWPDLQLAVRMILEKYVALGGYLLQAAVLEADVDRDTRVTMAEVLGFSNFEFMEKQLNVVLGLGQTGSAFVYLLEAQYRDEEVRWLHGYGEEAITMWLMALQVHRAENRIVKVDEVDAKKTLETSNTPS